MAVTIILKLLHVAVNTIIMKLFNVAVATSRTDP